jgi:hypothetical protein
MHTTIYRLNHASCFFSLLAYIRGRPFILGAQPGSKPRAWCKLGNYSTTELYAQPLHGYLEKEAEVLSSFHHHHHYQLYYGATNVSETKIIIINPTATLRARACPHLTGGNTDT